MSLFTSDSEFLISKRKATHIVLVAIFIVMIGLVIWENYWRANGYSPNNSDSPGLWALQRNKIHTNPRAIVSIGSSRIMFGLNLASLSSALNDDDIIQLASMVSAPMPFLENLANDDNFNGFIIVGVTTTFFSSENDAANLLNYYKNETVSEKISQRISQMLEQYFAFLDKDINLFTLVDRLPWPQNSGFIQAGSTPKLANITQHRQANMWGKLANDPSYQKHIQELWRPAFKVFFKNKPIPEENPLLPKAAKLVEKIRAKGGQVIFIRFPSSGPYLQWEEENYPRDKYWEQLLIQTQSFGIHFEDISTPGQFSLPDWSHLTQQDALEFTLLVAKFIKPIYADWKQSHSIAAQTP